MSRFKSSLDDVRVAAPCSVDWDSMYGNERIRFCDQCKLNVYNLSEMTRTEAERLVSQAEGRVCIRYYQRRDGSILTKNCPVGLAAIKRRLSRVATAIGSTVLSFFAGIGVYGIADRYSLVSYPLGGSVMGTIEISERPVSTPPLVRAANMGQAYIRKSKPPSSKRR
ncbi:MAG TPA: hypothetical protein VIK24_02485 [Pyrinomonadaceae bacterium]